MNGAFYNRLATFAVEACVNFGLPLMIYDWLAPAEGDFVALVTSSLVPLGWTLGCFIYQRRIDALSMLTILGIALALLAMLGGGSARLLQARESLVSAVIGLVFLGSAAIGRPLIYSLASAGVARQSPEKIAMFKELRNKPRFRRVMTVMTLVWGSGLLASSCLACALVFLLSIHEYLLISPIIGYATFGALTVWTIGYRRMAERSSAAASEKIT